MMTPRERRVLELKLERWLAAGGVKALFEAHEKSERIRKQVRELLRPNLETLNKPMTI